MSERIPVAIWQGTFRLFGVDLHCSVLDNGQRVIDAEDIHRLLCVTPGPGKAHYNEPGDVAEFVRWQRGEDQ